MVPPRAPGVTEHAFSATERRAVYRAIAERRDMRRFVPNATVPEDVLARLCRLHTPRRTGIRERNNVVDYSISISSVP